MAAKTALVTFTLIAAQLLLLASTPTTATPIAPATTTGTTAPSASVTDVPGEGEVAKAAADCWKVVRQGESCAVDIFRWFAVPDLAGHVSPACCGVLQKAGDRCIRDLFPVSAVGQLYDRFVSHACGVPIRATPSGRQ